MNAQDILKEAKEAYERGNYENAEIILANITESMGVEEYAEAQFHLGKIYHLQNNPIKAQSKYFDVKKEHSLKWYAYAQYNLGFLFINRDYEQVEKYLLSISIDMDKYSFNKSQLLIGTIKLKLEDFSDALSCFERISLDNSRESQRILRDMIMTLWISTLDNKFDLIVRFAEKILDNHTFEVRVLYKISKNQIKAVSSLLSDIHENIFALRNQLRLTQEYFNKYGSVAHYTQCDVGLILLDDRQSSWRFSSTSFMNDPTEGELIGKVLKINDKVKYDSNQYLAFASCFSFNHNSLNQFRLYGKKNYQEYSGVSLVVKDTFFDQQAIDYYLDITGVYTSSYIISKQSLYRCIYVDPDTNSGYLRVARRSKISFYRSTETRENALEEYNQYIKDLDKADEEINSCITNLKELVEKLKRSIKTEGIEQQEQVWALVNDILLPLRYLVKHAAFEEEEECRMIYITDMCDTKIQSDPEKKWLYVEYAEPVKDHIKKVYLGDGAKDYRPFFERALGDKSKMKDSNTPFRT